MRRTSMARSAGLVMCALAAVACSDRPQDHSSKPRVVAELTFHGAGGGTSFAWSTVKLFDGLPVRPLGAFTRAATLRATRSLAWACWIARSRQLRVICNDRVE